MPDDTDPTLRQLLSIPYRIEAQTIERAPGQWMRYASCPELPGCCAEAAMIVQTLDDLERKRIEIIVAALRAGRIPPRPRPPLGNSDPEGLIERFGLEAELLPLLDRPASQIMLRNI